MKQFNEEYIEYVKNNAPDVWDRIDAGISGGKVVSMKDKEKKRRMKKRNRYIRLAGSIAACLAAILLSVPVINMLRSSDKAEQSKVLAEKELADITIENSEVQDIELANNMSDHADAKADVQADTASANENNDEAVADNEEASQPEAIPEDSMETDADEAEQTGVGNTVAGANEEGDVKEAETNSEDTFLGQVESAEAEDDVVLLFRTQLEETETAVVYEAEMVSDHSKLFAQGEIIKISVSKDMLCEFVIADMGSYKVSLKKLPEDETGMKNAEILSIGDHF